MKKVTKVVAFAVTLILAITTLSYSGKAQAPNIQWQKKIGLNGNSTITSQVIQKSNNQYVSIEEVFGPISGGIYFTTRDSVGNIQMQNMIHNTSCVVMAFTKTFNNEYLIAGESFIGLGDAWVTRIDSVGNILWEKSLGGSKEDLVWSIIETTDHNIVFAGTTKSNDGDVSGNHWSNTSQSSDMWIVKLTGSGSLIWQKCVGGDSADQAYSITETISNDYLVVGSTQGDLPGYHIWSGFKWLTDGVIVKIDSSGNTRWLKCLGGKNNDELRSVTKTNDGNFIIAGTTSSKDGDLTSVYTGTPNEDGWIIKINDTGNIIWQKCYGFFIKYITKTKNSDFITIGLDSAANYQCVKIDSTGLLQWQKSIKDSVYDNALSVLETSDGGYLLSGTSDNKGMSQILIVKLSPQTVLALDRLHLNAVLEKDIVQLHWNSTERVILQRSSTGTDWEQLVQTSTTSYTDEKPLDGISYYRLKVLENDGNFHYSNIEKILYHLNEISVYPNPVQSSCTISGIKSGDIVQVSDMQGRVLFSKVSFDSMMCVDMSAYTKGLYVIKVNNQSTKVIKK
ncbi:MAG: T9SS type A sorting domain-containing protein [bacterium]